MVMRRDAMNLCPVSNGHDYTERIVMIENANLSVILGHLCVKYY